MPPSRSQSSIRERATEHAAGLVAHLIDDAPVVADPALQELLGRHRPGDAARPGVRTSGHLVTARAAPRPAWWSSWSPAASSWSWSAPAPSSWSWSARLRRGRGRHAGFVVVVVVRRLRRGRGRRRTGRGGRPRLLGRLRSRPLRRRCRRGLHAVARGADDRERDHSHQDPCRPPLHPCSDPPAGQMIGRRRNFLERCERESARAHILATGLSRLCARDWEPGRPRRR